MFKNKENATYEIKEENDVVKFFKKVKTNTMEGKMLFNEYKFLTNNSNVAFPKIIDFYTIDEYTILVLEYISGKQINYKYFPNIEDRLNIICRLLEEIKKFHVEGYVHCDINPNNILITKKNEVKLIDFGLVTKIGNNNCFKFGTLRYVSKEQLNDKEVDERTDIYSVGILMLEFIYNLDIYNGKSKKEIIRMKNSNNDFDIISKLKENEYYELAKIINNCIKNDVDLRYRNIDDLLQDIKLFVRNYINK